MKNIKVTCANTHLAYKNQFFRKFFNNLWNLQLSEKFSWKDKINKSSVKLLTEHIQKAAAARKFGTEQLLLDTLDTLTIILDNVEIWS